MMRFLDYLPCLVKINFCLFTDFKTVCGHFRTNGILKYYKVIILYFITRIKPKSTSKSVLQ